jgi:hypothetical protein
MYETNGVIYATRTNRNWSREERDLNAYLAGEHRYHSVGARSARDFLSHGFGKIDDGTTDVDAEGGPITERKPRILPVILASLRLRRPDRAGE